MGYGSVAMTVLSNGIVTLKGVHTKFIIHEIPVASTTSTSVC